MTTFFLIEQGRNDVFVIIPPSLVQVVRPLSIDDRDINYRFHVFTKLTLDYEKRIRLASILLALDTGHARYSGLAVVEVSIQGPTMGFHVEWLGPRLAVRPLLGMRFKVTVDGMSQYCKEPVAPERSCTMQCYARPDVTECDLFPSAFSAMTFVHMDQHRLYHIQVDVTVTTSSPSAKTAIDDFRSQDPIVGKLWLPRGARYSTADASAQSCHSSTEGEMQLFMVDGDNPRTELFCAENSNNIP